MAIKNAEKVAAQNLINTNPDIWGAAGFTRIFNSKYRNSQNHVFWVSHGPLTDRQYASISANATALGWISDGTLRIARDKDISPSQALSDWGLTPETVE